MNMKVAGVTSTAEDSVDEGHLLFSDTQPFPAAESEKLAAAAQKPCCRESGLIVPLVGKAVW